MPYMYPYSTECIPIFTTIGYSCEKFMSHDCLPADKGL